MASLKQTETRFLLDLILDRMQELRRDVVHLKEHVASLRAGNDELLTRLADGRVSSHSGEKN